MQASSRWRVHIFLQLYRHIMVAKYNGTMVCSSYQSKASVIFSQYFSRFYDIELQVKERQVEHTNKDMERSELRLKSNRVQGSENRKWLTRTAPVRQTELSSASLMNMTYNYNP